MRVVPLAIVALLVSAQWSFAATGDPVVDLLIRKLVEKKVISSEDAQDLEKDLKKAVDERTRGSVKESATEVSKPAKMEAKEEAREEAKEPSKFAFPFELKVRAQTRFDAGDLLVGPEGRYVTENDLFFRRVRLEIDKEFKNPPLGKKLDLDLTLDADRAEQDFRSGERQNPSNRIDLHYLYADWVFFDELAVQIGKHKLPFLRAPLTSSSRQLLIERPASDSVVNDTFGSYEQPQVMIHGEFMGGAMRYYASYADGANNQDAVDDLDSSADAVQKQRWGNAYLGRVEIAPLGLIGGTGFIEHKKDDTGIGGENHLTLGIDGGAQHGIKYATSSVADARLNTWLVSADLAGRYTFGTMGTITGQGEYIVLKKDFNYRDDEVPQAGYLQVGYLLPWVILHGRLEPAARYEIFDHDRVENEGESGTRERTFTVGFNHYLLKHSLKWAYNFALTDFDKGVAEAANEKTRKIHELLLQLYF